MRLFSVRSFNILEGEFLVSDVKAFNIQQNLVHQTLQTIKPSLEHPIPLLFIQVQFMHQFQQAIPRINDVSRIQTCSPPIVVAGQVVDLVLRVRATRRPPMPTGAPIAHPPPFGPAK